MLMWGRGAVFVIWTGVTIYFAANGNGTPILVALNGMVAATSLLLFVKALAH